MQKKILHFGQNEDYPDSYDLVISAAGPDLNLVRKQLADRLFRVTEYQGNITAIFTGEWEAIVNRLRFLEREGWQL